ncbi:hypothetical protein LguiB_028281 [Lonicera macranthoides]
MKSNSLKRSCAILKILANSLCSLSILNNSSTTDSSNFKAELNPVNALILLDTSFEGS